MMTKEFIDDAMSRVTGKKRNEIIGGTGNPGADIWGVIMTGLFGSCSDDPNPWWHYGDSGNNPPPSTGYGCTAR